MVTSLELYEALILDTYQLERVDNAQNLYMEVFAAVWYGAG